MSFPVRPPKSRRVTDPWRHRVDSGDWDAVTAEVNEYGGALLPQLLTGAETARIRSLYEDGQYFRATVGKIPGVTPLGRENFAGVAVAAGGARLRRALPRGGAGRSGMLWVAVVR
jgi:hypothetical protein